MKVVPQLDTWPGLVRRIQTPAGKAAGLGVFALLLLCNGNPFWLELTALTSAIGLFPRHRRRTLSLLAGYWILRNGGNWFGFGLLVRVAATAGVTDRFVLGMAMAGAIVAMFVALYVLFRAAGRYPDRLVGRRPVLILVGSYLLVLGLAGNLPLPGPIRVAVWLALLVFSHYLWYFAYALADSTHKQADPYALQFGTFSPFWTGTRASPTPIGKGAAFLRKVEVREPADLAVVQLKAIKLLIWVLILNLSRGVFQGGMHGGFSHLFDGSFTLNAAVSKVYLALPFLGTVPAFNVPYLEAAIEHVAAGNIISAPMAWATLISHFLEAVVGLTAGGNQVVACCRMSGFNVLRNTYKPLYARTVAEFWNRYYYYFKELLVDFFFFPTYTRYFKKYPRLRLAVATFAAATLGNALYHFCRDIRYVFDLGFWNALLGFRVYLFYAAVLGSGIAVSQLRGRRAHYDRLPPYRRVLASIGVIAFFCLLEVFDYEGRSHSLGAHFAFFFSLFP